MVSLIQNTTVSRIFNEPAKVSKWQSGQPGLKITNLMCLTHQPRSFWDKIETTDNIGQAKPFFSFFSLSFKKQLVAITLLLRHAKLRLKVKQKGVTT